jgi:hypothetical protein
LQRLATVFSYAAGTRYCPAHAGKQVPQTPSRQSFEPWTGWLAGSASTHSSVRLARVSENPAAGRFQRLACTRLPAKFRMEFTDEARRSARNSRVRAPREATREADAAECLLWSEQMETQSFSHRWSYDGTGHCSDCHRGPCCRANLARGARHPAKSIIWFFARSIFEIATKSYQDRHQCFSIESLAARHRFLRKFIDLCFNPTQPCRTNHHSLGSTQPFPD